MTIHISPPISSSLALVTSVKKTGYAVLNSSSFFEVIGCMQSDLAKWQVSWNDLRPDLYLKDGGHYRRRRHSCFTVNGQHVVQMAHRPHWQPLEYNALHGGMQRLFEAMSDEITQSPVWKSVLSRLCEIFTQLKPNVKTWFVEAHQFRIDTTDGIGRPTPEGAHRDGVDFVVVVLIARQNIKGGETRVFDVNGPSGLRFTMTEPWSLLFLDDERVIHESTPIQPLQADSDIGYRDTLVLTFRAGGFQGDGEIGGAA